MECSDCFSCSGEHLYFSYMYSIKIPLLSTEDKEYFYCDMGHRHQPCHQRILQYFEKLVNIIPKSLRGQGTEEYQLSAVHAEMSLACSWSYEAHHRSPAEHEGFCGELCYGYPSNDLDLSLP